MKEEAIETVRRLMMGLLEVMGMKTEVEATLRGEGFFLDIMGDKEGILIGKHGRTLESLQFLFNRMVNKQLKEGVKVYIDVNGYKAKRADSLTKMAARLGERVKKAEKALMIGPLNSHDRRIIHLALKEDPALETESLGDGEMKRIRIIPKSQTP
ncbi:MAG: KH domain-containing protein [Deltaproteobacteria bacterium]|nr:KH domain-containing protein [Deltaproteobacteria bacterium]